MADSENKILYDPDSPIIRTEKIPPVPTTIEELEQIPPENELQSMELDNLPEGGNSPFRRLFQKWHDWSYDALEIARQNPNNKKIQEWAEEVGRRWELVHYEYMRRLKSEKKISKNKIY